MPRTSSRPGKLRRASGTSAPAIRALRRADRRQWEALWAQYLRFYRQHLPQEVTAATFARLVDEQAQPHALVAERDGTLVGFAHFTFHPSTWSLTDLCYLEDLFVAPGSRGARQRAGLDSRGVRGGGSRARRLGILDDAGIQRRRARALRHAGPQNLVHTLRTLACGRSSQRAASAASSRGAPRASGAPRSAARAAECPAVSPVRIAGCGRLAWRAR